MAYGMCGVESRFYAVVTLSYSWSPIINLDGRLVSRFQILSTRRDFPFCLLIMRKPSSSLYSFDAGFNAGTFFFDVGSSADGELFCAVFTARNGNASINEVLWFRFDYVILQTPRYGESYLYFFFQCTSKKVLFCRRSGEFTFTNTGNMTGKEVSTMTDNCVAGDVLRGIAALIDIIVGD